MTDSETWQQYYQKTGERPPRPTLLFALDEFDAEAKVACRLAVDLGSGNGRDTAELLRRGWRVVTVDAEPKAIEGLRARFDGDAGGLLEARVVRFEDVELPDCDLINSSFALPLCPPAAFPGVWRKIRNALRPGGRFAGQLYGERDSWRGDPTMTFHTRAEAESLLVGYDVEHFREEEDNSVTPRGQPKHWHIFHIVGRKR